jgi:dCMP deaminase
MRPDAHETWMTVALVVAQRATCARRRVGAVICDERGHIMATGYNGPAAGHPHCTETPCLGHLGQTGRDLDLCEAVHAEQNALAQCPDIHRAHRLYCTTAPCMSCMKLLLNTPIQAIYYAEHYPGISQASALWCRTPGRTITQLKL